MTLLFTLWVENIFAEVLSHENNILYLLEIDNKLRES